MTIPDQLSDGSHDSAWRHIEALLRDDAARLPSGDVPGRPGPPPPEVPAARFTSGTPQSRHGGRRLAALVATSFLAGGLGGGAGYAVFGPDRTVTKTVVATGSAPITSAAAAPATVAGSTAESGATHLTVAEIVGRIEPSVVSVTSTYRSVYGSATGAGTGIVLSTGGEIVTNAHVVEDAVSVHVTVAGESEAREATVVGLDTANDIALLTVSDTSGLVPAAIGDSTRASVGDDVVAIGNALSLEGLPTVTKGIVSALDRSIETENGAMTGLVQTDASISSGNSGGPLVNSAGEVIAINSVVATSGRGTAAENIGFAIPMAKVNEVLARLRSGESPAASTAYLGVTMTDRADGSAGAQISQVESGSPADAAGLEVDDVVVAVDGEAVSGVNDLSGHIRSAQPGDRLALTVERDGSTRTLRATLGTRGA